VVISLDFAGFLVVAAAEQGAAVAGLAHLQRENHLARTPERDPDRGISERSPNRVKGLTIALVDAVNARCGEG
jgi:hypothetical protein